MKEIILEFALLIALAAFFLMWAKWEEEKVKTREERERRWDEISFNLTAEKAQEEQTEITYQYSVLARDAHLAAMYADNENVRLQDRLSALLCPMNDHVWKDGCCVKCGRVKDATASPN